MTSSSAAVSPDLVAAALDAADAEERRQATSLIGELFLHDALPLLVRALGDSDWRVRKEATRAAHAFVPAPGLVSAMIALFQPGENVGLRNAAVDVLGSCGGAATGPLALALTRLDADGRKLVVQALGATCDPHALIVLSRALVDSDSNVRQGAVEAVSRLGPLAPTDAQKLLLRSLAGDDPFCKLAALEGLNTLGAQVPWDKLEPLLDEPTLRAAALTAAASAEDERAPMAVARVANTTRGNAFVLAITALERMAEGSLLPHVAAALEAQGPALAERLLQMVTSVGVEAEHHRGSALLLAAIAAAPGIVDVAAHALEDELLGEVAERALRLLGPKVLPDLVARIAPAQDGSNVSPEARAAFVDAATSLVQAAGQPAGLSALLSALRAAVVENERRVTTSALCALSRLGEEKDLGLTAQFVMSSFRSVAQAAEVALSILTRRYPEAARRLVDTLNEKAMQGSHEDACIAVIIIGALAAMPSASRQSFTSPDMLLLTRSASADDPRIRRTAIEALAVVGDDAAFRVIALALADDSREVQIEAARALGVVARRACFRGPPDPTSHAPTLRSVLELVTRSMDSELLAATIRMVSEDLDVDLRDSPTPHAAATILAGLGPLAREADGTIALAAVEAIGRLPMDTEGRQKALAEALRHPDDAVIKAAMLKIDFNRGAGSEILQCLDHPSYDVRSLAAELVAGSEDAALRERLAERTSLEVNRDMRDTLEGALSSIRWRGERSTGAS